MNKVTNTSENQMFGWLMGGNPGAIEAQEAQGQRELVESSQLPAKVNSRSINIIEQYALMGIAVIGETKGDKLFLDVELPKGWKLESTDHSMWSRLVDDKDRERASIFYKAAFYDRDAFVNFSTRYNWSGNLEKDGYVSYIVKDNSTGKIIFETESVSKDYERADYFKEQDMLHDQCKQFLKDNFPKHQDVNAYWD